MSVHRDEHLDLCAGYVLGALGPEERRTLEAHLAEGCATCEAELERLGHGAHVFASATPLRRAPKAARGRVLEAVRAEARAERGGSRSEPRRGSDAPLRLPPRRRGLEWAWAAAAAAAIAIAAGLLQWRGAMEMRRELNAARTQLEATRQQAAALERALGVEREWATLWAAPRVREIRLEPTPDGSPTLLAKVSYDPDSRRAVVAVSNFAAPAGKDYQLWAITGSGPVSLGLVRADASGHAFLRLDNVAGGEAPAAFAVSLEEAGGAPTPRAPAGPVVLVGKVGA